MGRLLWEGLLVSCVVLFGALKVKAEGNVPCKNPAEVPCLTSSQCIRKALWCDGEEDCGDGTDEKFCLGSKWYNADPNECDSRTDELFRCNSGLCWPVVTKCDGHKDCKDGDDEKDCGASGAQTTEKPITEKSAKKELEADESSEYKKSDEKSDEKKDENDDDYTDEDDNGELLPEISMIPILPTVPSPASISILRTTATTWQSTSEVTKSFYDRRIEQATPHPSVQPPRRTDHRAHIGGQHPSPGGVATPTFRSSVNRYPPPSHYNRSRFGPFRRFRNSVPDEFDEDRRQYNHYHNSPNYYNHRDPTRYISDPRYRVPNSRNQRYFSRNTGREITFNRQHKVLYPFHFRTDYGTSYRSANQAAITKARHWLLGPGRQGGMDWGNNTLRALVALSLSGNNSWSEDHQNDIWKKNLMVDLGIQLLSKNVMSIHRLSQYVLALLATCQDPRNFEGHDLAEDLRTKLVRQNSQSPSMYNPVASPIVYLAMCLSGLELSYSEARHLMAVMSRPPPDHEYSRDSSVLALEAFSCYLQQQLQLHGADRVSNHQQISHDAVGRLLQRMADDGSFGSVYSTSLAVQALVSLNESLQWNHQETFRYLRNQQHPDGSFGDFLSTYYALPALAGKSLLHLRNTQCPQESKATQENELTPWEILNHPSRMFYIRFSLHFGNPLSNAHTIQLLVPKGINFFDVMRVAEYQDRNFRFSAEVENSHMKVFSFSETPNDPILGLAWHLYVKTTSDPTVLIPTERYAGDIREFLPIPEQHIIFWYHPVTRF